MNSRIGIEELGIGALGIGGIIFVRKLMKSGIDPITDPIVKSVKSPIVKSPIVKLPIVKSQSSIPSYAIILILCLIAIIAAYFLSKKYQVNISAKLIDDMQFLSKQYSLN